MHQSCRVQFSFDKKNKTHLVFSLPQTNHYQEISNLSLEPKPLKTLSDEWGNRVACFGNRKNTVVEFLYSPKSLDKTIQKNWTLSHYKVNVNNKLFITPNRFINGEDTKIKKFSQSLIKKEQNVFIIAQTFYGFILDYLSYGKPTEGLYPYTQALEEKVTDCGGFSTLLLSLFQSVGIPGRLVVGFVTKDNLVKLKDFSMHAWTEILLPDRTWFPMDPSVEWRRKNNQSKRNGGFGKIPADRLITSFGQDFTITIDSKKYTIDLLQLPIYL